MWDAARDMAERVSEEVQIVFFGCLFNCLLSFSIAGVGVCTKTKRVVDRS